MHTSLSARKRIHPPVIHDVTLLVLAAPSLSQPTTTRSTTWTARSSPRTLYTSSATSNLLQTTPGAHPAPFQALTRPERFATSPLCDNEWQNPANDPLHIFRGPSRSSTAKMSTKSLAFPSLRRDQQRQQSMSLPRKVRRPLQYICTASWVPAPEYSSRRTFADFLSAFPGELSGWVESKKMLGSASDNDNDNDTLREVPHRSNEGLALQARVSGPWPHKKESVLQVKLALWQGVQVQTVVDRV